MKPFKHYLTESERTYNFRIKIANMIEDEVMDKLEDALGKFELKSLSKPKKTPIQEHPMDFQTLTNSEVYMMDAEMGYPVTANTLYEYLKHAIGIAPNEIVVINKDHPEEIAREEAVKEEGEIYSAKLDDAEYKDQKEIKVDSLYGDKYNENMLKTIETRKYEFAKEGK
jgi:hypothetical protein|tara:strand:+ start:2334 stop:2840 length:507 start_codon:yes stop_codon:yes gene_type:complete